MPIERLKKMKFYVSIKSNLLCTYLRILRCGCDIGFPQNFSIKILPIRFLINLNVVIPNEFVEQTNKHNSLLSANYQRGVNDSIKEAVQVHKVPKVQ